MNQKNSALFTKTLFIHLMVFAMSASSLIGCSQKYKHNDRTLSSLAPCRHSGTASELKGGMADCFQRGQLFFDAPNPSASELVAGPQLEESITFASNEELYCSLFTKPENGKSKKFRCYRTNERGEFFDKKGILVTEAYSVNSEHVLVDKDGKPLLNSKGKPRKADKLKVKYTLGSSRDREVFTEVAATRFFWLLGLASDHMYPVAKVNCFGCGEDPFKEQKIQYRSNSSNKSSDVLNENALRTVNSFTLTSLERKFEGEEIVPDPKSDGFTWDEVAKRNPQRAEIEAMVLANNIIAQGSDIAKQQAAACSIKGSNADGTCSEPWLYVQDVGASFGSRSGMTNPRGDFSEWSKTPVFSSGCNLMFPLGGIKKISSAGYSFLKERLSKVRYEQILSIVETAKFDVVDPDLVSAIAKQRRGISQPELKKLVLTQWAQKWWEKINTVLNANCQ